MLGVKGKVNTKLKVKAKVKVKASVCMQRRLMWKLRYISNFDPGTKRRLAVGLINLRDPFNGKTGVPQGPVWTSR